MAALLLLAGCPRRVDTGLPDPADSARPDTGAPDTGGGRDSDTGSTTTPSGPDADCDGVDDDGNGVADDGAPEGWALDPGRWTELAVIEDPADPRYVGGLAMGAGARWVVVGELADNFADGAVSLREWTSGGLQERARLDDPELIPFAYAATVDLEGRLWFGGSWWDASTSERVLFVAGWNGSGVAELPVKDELGSVRLTAAAATDDGRTWWAGYGDWGEGSRPVVWESDGAQVSVSHQVDVEGRFAALAADAASVLGAGWTGDAPTTALLDQYTSGDWRRESALPDTRAVAVAVGADGVPLYAHTASDGTGWSVRQWYEPVDEADGDIQHLVQSGVRTFAIGAVEVGGTRAVQVRVGEAGRWAGYTLPTDPAWQVEPRVVTVDELGRLWLATSELSTDSSAPGRARLLRLDCR